MPTTPDPVTTVIDILNANWGAGGGTQPTTTDMVQTKRPSTSDVERFLVYSRAPDYTVEGLTQQHYSRVDRVSILWQSAGPNQALANTRARMSTVLTELERVFSLSTVRSNPTTSPTGAQYDVIKPLGASPADDKTRGLFGFTFELELYEYWTGR